MTFCKPDVSDVLKSNILKPDVLKPDVLWVYLVPGESGRERILCESGNESRREIKLGESGCERSLA